MTYRLVRGVRAAPTVPVLDEAQRQVVDHDQGRLLVLAGPGTGKTTTLVEAAVARVARGTPPDRLLMLTFGRRAAAELRDRVTARLGRTVQEPVARTLHSYAFGLLRMADAPVIPRLLSGPEQDVVIRELIAGDLEAGTSPWPEALRPALRTRAFAGELRTLLMRAIERGLDGPALAALGRQTGRSDWQAAGRFLQQYHDVTALSRPGSYDPAELIRAAVQALQADPALLSTERARRRRIFVDEYQDTDPAQAELLALLADGGQELVIVGDPDQAIYAFRGADPNALDGVLAGADVIALGTARRSGPALLAASRRVAARLPGSATHRSLVAATGLPPGALDVTLLRSINEEAAFVASRLRQAHLDGLRWSRMAVLVRSTTTSLAVIRRALTTAGVPVAVRGDDVPLGEQSVVDHLLALLVASYSEAEISEDLAQRLLMGPLGRADALGLRRLRRELRQLSAAAGDDPDGPLFGPALLDLPGARVLPGRVSAPVIRLAGAISAGRAASGGAEEVLWAVWSALGLTPAWEHLSGGGGSAGAAADRDLDAVLGLFDTAARFVDRLPNAGVGAFVDHVAAQQIPGETADLRGADQEAVRVLTAHAAKGLEWDLVCVAGVQEGVWPDLRPRGSLLGSTELVDVVAGRTGPGLSSLAPLLAEERRLFYVAVTRARRSLLVTAVVGEDEQPSRFLDELVPNSTEQAPMTTRPKTNLPEVVASLRAFLADPRTDARLQAGAAQQLARLQRANVAGADPATWWGLSDLSSSGPVADPDRLVRISPSAVEAFGTCQVKALLEQFGVRDGDSAVASLGIVIHDVAAAGAQTSDPVELRRLLDQHWATLDFGARWLAVHKRADAEQILDRMADWLQNGRAGLAFVKAEEEFSVEVGDARVKGRIDRLERDAEGRLVVIDWKTGGSTYRDRMDGHPQLGVYQLAVAQGGFDQYGSPVPGGGRLVQLGATRKYSVQAQAPLAELDPPDWVVTRVAELAALLRGTSFTATVNDRCATCKLKACCPLQPQGRQVPS